MILLDLQNLENTCSLNSVLYDSGAFCAEIICTWHDVDDDGDDLQMLWKWHSDEWEVCS